MVHCKCFCSDCHKNSLTINLSFRVKHFSQFQFVEQNSVECWCDFWCKFGATLYATILTIFTISCVNATKTHDKATISHDILRYSRYQTVFLKFQEIICAAYRAVRTTLAARRELLCNSPKRRYISIYKKLCNAGLFVFVFS